jgi:Putative transposase
VPPATWEKDWVVHAEPVGSGQQALKSLAPDIFRVALNNQRILRLEDGHVTFQDTAAKTDTLNTQILPVEEFIRRFLPHVLPSRFINVRYYGFLSSRNRHRLAQVNERLNVKPLEKPQPPHAPAEVPAVQSAEMRCPRCGSVMQLVGDIVPTRLRLHGARASP